MRHRLLLGLARPPWRAATAIATGEDDHSSPAERVDRLDAKAFFRMACRLLEDNPPRVEDRRLMERAHQIGLFTRCDDAWMGGDAELQRRVERGTGRGRAAVRRRAASVMGDASGNGTSSIGGAISGPTTCRAPVRPAHW